MATGYEIKRLRTQEKKSAQEVADFIGVDAARLRKWEERDTDPKDSGDLKKVLEYFNIEALTDLSKFDKFKFSHKVSSAGPDLYKEKYIALLEQQLAQANENLAKVTEAAKKQAEIIEGSLKELLKKK